MSESTNTSVSTPEPERLKVRSYNPSEVNLKDFKFKSAKQIDKKVRRAERLLSFDDPESPGEPINILLRALTENEESILNRAVLSKEDIAPLVDTFLEKTEKGEKIETSDMTDTLATKVISTQEDDKVATEKFYRRIQMGIVKPTAVTIEWLKRRNPNMLDILYDTLDELAIENQSWVLEQIEQ